MIAFILPSKPINFANILVNSGNSATAAIPPQTIIRTKSFKKDCPGFCLMNFSRPKNIMRHDIARIAT